MEITQHSGTDYIEFRLTGRLDATWAEHVGNTIETAVRAGSHHIVLNFAGVDYISSLGIRVLLNHYKRLKSVNGSLEVSQPSNATLAILKAAGLGGILLSSNVSTVSAPATPKTVSSVTRGNATYHSYPQTVSTPLTCKIVGHPEKLRVGGFAESECRNLTFANGSFGIGLGAFGKGFPDCRDRFGEFLAVGGCAITLPTNDPHALPDYVVTESGLVPSIETLYALSGAGDFPAMIRFDANTEGSGKVGLTELVEAMLEFSGGEIVTFSVLAEAAGLVGAALRRSPAAGPVSLELPGVRDAMSFTTERNSERSLALLVGVAARQVPESVAAFLRPMKTTDQVQAHVHAAVFPYRPVQRGELNLGKTVSELLSASTPSTVMHLMADTRPFEGVGETDLVRGACWIGSLKEITAI